MNDTLVYVSTVWLIKKINNYKLTNYKNVSLSPDHFASISLNSICTMLDIQDFILFFSRPYAVLLSFF